MIKTRKPLWAIGLCIFLGVLFVALWVWDSHRYEGEVLDEYTYDGMEVPDYAR